MATNFPIKQVAQNQVKVATDGIFCADTIFVQTSLKNFVFTWRLRSRYSKGTPELALYTSKKIGTIRCTDRIIYIERKVTYTVISKMKLKLGWKFLINPSFLRSNFFSKCSKKFLLAIWWCSRYVKGVFNLVLCARKNYSRTISTSKYIRKSWPPSPPQRGVNNFNATLT